MAAIEGEPCIESVPVEPGLTNAPQEATRLVGDSTESNIQNEGIYYFDVKFSARVSEKRVIEFGIRIIVDVEGQYDFHPGYDVVTRGVFYGARMISSQSGTEFVGEDFDNLRKVYSIWICMDPPDYAANSIVRFSVKPEVLSGKFPQEKLDSMKYDLMDVVLVFISTGKTTGVKDELCGMLEVLLADELDKEQRLSSLEADYGMKRTVELERGVDMCDYSKGIAKKHFIKGWTEGAAEGKAEGELIGSIAKSEQVYKNCRSRGMSREDSIAIADFPADYDLNKLQ